MKINIKNAEKLNEAIKKAEGKATARLLKVEDVKRLLEAVEKQLNLPKALMKGVKVHGCPTGQDFPNAYKFAPQATCFDAEYCASGWCVVDVKRDTCPRWKDKAVITLTEEAKYAILQNMSRLTCENMPRFNVW